MNSPRMAIALRNEQMMRRILMMIAISMMACSASTAPRDWRIEITTEGGFTGRGIGNATITPQSVASCDHAALDRALKDAKPSNWKHEYREPSNPHGYADQVLTTMTVTIDGKTTTTSWYSGARDLVAKDAMAVFEAAWALRGCGSSAER